MSSMFSTFSKGKTRKQHSRADIDTIFFLWYDMYIKRHTMIYKRKEGVVMTKYEDRHKDVMIQVRLPKEVRDEFKQIVDKKMQTQAKVLRMLIERYIQDNRS